MKKMAKEAHPLAKMSMENLVMLPTPPSISYMWNMGSMLGMSLMIQILTGILLASHYTPETSMAFESTTHISREVNWGDLTRTIHSNMASLFFALMFMHVFRGLLNSSYKKTETWMSGVSIIFILMGTAFMGYVLPWGQMSFWGATVITNLMSAIPIWGNDIVQWFWGGFSVGNPTLNRFFPLHFLMPFILLTMMLIHLMTLHSNGSSNPMGTQSKMEMTPFHPKFSIKDILAPTVILTAAIIMTDKWPDTLMDPENFITANPMVTPVHIQPEWYFLFAYAILRGIPNKMGGVMALMMSILIITTLSMKKKMKSSSKFNPKSKATLMATAASFFIMTSMGAKPMEEPYMMTSKTASMIYFSSIVA